MSTLTRAAYEKMIAENREWLSRQPRTLEREHVDLILQRSADHEYGEASTLRAQLAETERRLTESREAESLVSTRLAAVESKFERFVKGTTEEELRCHGLASLTALGNAEHRAEDAEAACAARDEALRQFTAVMICNWTHNEECGRSDECEDSDAAHPCCRHEDEPCPKCECGMSKLYAADTAARALLTAPNPGSEYVHRDVVMRVAERVREECLQVVFVECKRGHDMDVDLDALVKEVLP